MSSGSRAASKESPHHVRGHFANIYLSSLPTVPPASSRNDPRTRTEPDIFVRVERGHVSLEERCSEGFGVETEEDGLGFCDVETYEEDDEQEFAEMWGEFYREEVEVMGGSGAGSGKSAGVLKSPRRATEALDYPGGSTPDSTWGIETGPY